MHGPQVERLKKDSRELEYFMRKLQKSGNSKKAHVIQKKLEYLDNKIEELVKNVENKELLGLNKKDLYSHSLNNFNKFFRSIIGDPEELI